MLLPSFHKLTGHRLTKKPLRPAFLAVILFVLPAITNGCVFESATPQPPPTAIRAPTATAPSTPGDSVETEHSTEHSKERVFFEVMVGVTPADIPKYDRSEWRHWTDVDGDCQDARQETLIEESLTPVTFKTGDKCRVATGSWTGPYTGIAVNDPSQLDIDHMVPLANAHRSGGWKWDREKKAAYANDLTYANHLIATTRSANRSKGADGPEAWRPPDETYWCDYAIAWVTVKGQWELFATEEESNALSEMLDTCETPPGFESRPLAAPVAPSPSNATPQDPTPPPATAATPTPSPSPTAAPQSRPGTNAPQPTPTPLPTPVTLP